jgi:hypothetical protein
MNKDADRSDFDPYYLWLGIPPNQQPPDHYRLLGLQVFEGNPEVIRAAVMRQSAHLKTYQLGQHADLTQKLLNEVSTAKACLLDPRRKASYDARLRDETETPQATAIPLPRPARSPAPARKPEAVRVVAPTPAIVLPFDVSPATSTIAHARIASAEKTSDPGVAKTPAVKKKLRFQINYMVVAVALVAGTAAGLFYAWMSGSDPKAGKSGGQAATAPADEAPADAGKAEEAKKKELPSLDLLILGKDGRPVGPAKTNTAKPEKKPDKTDTAATDKWFDASKEPAVGKNVGVAVRSAKLGHFIRGSSSMLRVGMKLTLQITNNLEDRRLKCEWSVLRQVQPDSMLVDNFAQPNAYSLNKVIPKSDAPIDPKESSEVDLIFEKPFKTAKYLHLKLPGEIFNQPDPISIEIPIDMIKPADENVDGIPGVNGPAAPEIPDIGLPEPKTNWQPRGGRDMQVADAESDCFPRAVVLLTLRVRPNLTRSVRSTAEPHAEREEYPRTSATY